ncbi:hypothetical protein ACOMHN_064408 [Nucella lapillus]
MPKAVSRLEVMQVCKLLQCVRTKDKEQAEKLFSNGIPNLINYIDADEGTTALHIAAIANDDDMVQFLLDMGAHPDVADLKGRTAAMQAIEYGHIQSFEKLIRARADMTLCDLESKAILFYCISNTERHTKCLLLALKHGADVNNRAKIGTPIFLQACETAAQNEFLCLTLLHRGADPNSKMEKSNRTSLMAASESGSLKVVKAILSRGGAVNILDIRKNNAAHFAAKGGHLQCLMCMAGYGSNFEQVNMDGNTAIHMAALGGHAMCCKFLAQRGCNPKAKNHNDLTGRMIAKDDGHKEATKELKKAEKAFGNIGKNNQPWAVALYDWIMQHYQQTLNLLTQFDAEKTGTVSQVNFCNIFHKLKAPVKEFYLEMLTAMHDKARDDNVDYLELLGAKKWIHKNYMTTNFEAKKKKTRKGGRKGGKRGKFSLVMPICTRDEGPRTCGGGPPELYIPRYIHFTDLGRFDRDHPPAHPLQDDSGWYLQHPDHVYDDSVWYLQNPDRAYVNINEAAKMGDFDSLKNALKKGVAIDTRDKFYKTALMTASAAGHFSMVKFLVELGASVNLRDNFKWTALHHACHAGQLDVVQFLVDKGGEMDAPTLGGGTPLTHSIETSREEVVQFFIDHGAKMLTETRKGLTPMDITHAWADARVTMIVQTKWDTLPHLDKGKKKAKGGNRGGKGGGKNRRPLSAPGEKDGNAQHHHYHLARHLTVDDALALHRKGSIMREASALAKNLDERERITYIPLKAWTPQPTTRELIHMKEVQRERFGWEVDFPDFQMPFKKNVTKKLAMMEED